MMMIGIIHSNDTYAIDFEHERIDPKDRVVYTGQGYFSVYYDGSAHNASAWEATYSKDKVNWRNAVTDSNYKFLDRLVNSSNIPTSQVIETNDGYMIREKPAHWLCHRRGGSAAGEPPAGDAAPLLRGAVRLRFRLRLPLPGHEQGAASRRAGGAHPAGQGRGAAFGRPLCTARHRPPVPAALAAHPISARHCRAGNGAGRVLGCIKL